MDQKALPSPLLICSKDPVTPTFRVKQVSNISSYDPDHLHQVYSGDIKITHGVFYLTIYISQCHKEGFLFAFACEHAELEGAMRSPKRVLKSGDLASQFKSSSMLKSGYATKGSTCTAGALSFFMLPQKIYPC
jgi:hypothetical protein